MLMEWASQQMQEWVIPLRLLKTTRAPAVSENSQKELLSANWEKGPTFSAKLYRSASIEKDIKNNLGTNKGKFNLNQSRKIILT